MVDPPSVSVQSNADNSTNNDDDTDEMEEQLEEYQEMLEDLGNHADKVTINLLTMVAEDHGASPKAASSLYNCIRSLLMSPILQPERILPLVYVIDSILKNVKQQFIPLIETDAQEWIPVVYASLHKHATTKAHNAKLKKVIHIWKEFQVFKTEAVQNMILCYEKAEANAAIQKIDSAKTRGNNNNDESDPLKNLPGNLKKKMQELLDEIHSDVDELDKVSLERLAIINPSLLEKIKNIAINDMNENADEGSKDVTKHDYPHENSLFANHMPKEHLKRSQDWLKISFTNKDAGDLVNRLQHHVMTTSKESCSNPNETSTKIPKLVATASSMANQISRMLQFLQDNDANSESNIIHNDKSSFMHPFFNNIYTENALVNNGTNIAQISTKLQQSNSHSFANLLDKSLFTTEGVAAKYKHHVRIVSMLYEEGLPFLSTSDGRRFKTQIELSNHLDNLFRKSQLEKTMERTEERGWHGSSLEWSGVPSSAGKIDNESLGNTNSNQDGETEAVEQTTVHADENRSRCVICGNPFEMYFDQEEGDHMYKNCREIQLLNDEAAEEEFENVLVHLRCLEGLGSPTLLMMDQVLQT